METYEKKDITNGVCKECLEILTKEIEKIKAKNPKGWLKKQKTDRYFDFKDLQIGAQVEMEHTGDWTTAKTIAKAHLLEDRDYYRKLYKMEQGGKMKNPFMSKKPIIVWDEDADAEIEYRFKNKEEFGYDPETTEEQIREQIYNDSDYWQMLWDDEMMYLTEILEKKNKDGYWHATVKNFGWRARSGEAYIKAETGSEFLSAILPKTDCHFKIFNYGKGLAIQNAHHDSPMGNEWYYIMPISSETYYKHKG